MAPKNTKENDPPGEHTPRSSAASAAAAPTGLSARNPNLPRESAASISADKPPPGQSAVSQGKKPAAETKQSASDHKEETVEYTIPSDGSSAQVASVPPTHPPYENPIDMSLPPHWTSWLSEEYEPPGAFTDGLIKVQRAVRTYNSPPLSAIVVAIQSIRPDTDELTEPYIEIRLRQQSMQRWPEALKAVQELMQRHLPASDLHVRIRFNFEDGVAFSSDESDDSKLYTPLRKHFKAVMNPLYDTPKPLRDTYGSGRRPQTTAERAESVIWREDKANNLGKTTPVGTSIGVKDGRLAKPRYSTGSCGPKFRMYNIKNGGYETYDDGTDAFFVITCHHAMHQKGDRQPIKPDELNNKFPNGRLAVTHPTRRDWEATVFSRQDRAATYEKELQRQDLDAQTRADITRTRDDDLEYHKANNPSAVEVGELFLSCGQQAVYFTNKETGPLLDNSGMAYLSDLAVLKLDKDVADEFDNTLPNNEPIPKAFAAEFDVFRAHPHITGTEDLDPSQEPLLIKDGRTTGITAGRLQSKRVAHHVCDDNSMDAQKDYCMKPVEAAKAIAYFGDSGAGVYNSRRKWVGIVTSGHKKKDVDTPVYIMPIQLIKAELKRMGFRLDFCPPGTKAAPAPSSSGAVDYSTMSKTAAKKQKKKEREALAAQEAQRKLEEEEIESHAAPDGSSGVVLAVEPANIQEELMYRVRFQDKEKLYPGSMLGVSWQHAIDAFWAQQSGSKN